MIVDDDPVYRRTLRALLDDCELDVVGEAADGLAGIELAGRLVPDVVVMDYCMPGLSGLEATRRLVAGLPGVAVVMCTACDEQLVGDAARQAGAAAVLFKGEHPMRLVEAISRAGAGAATAEPVGAVARG